MKKINSNENSIVWIFLLICSVLPVFDFLQENIIEARLMPYRSIYYVIANFIIQGLLYLGLRLCFKRISMLKLGFAVGIGFTALSYLFIIHQYVIKLLADSYQFRYFLMISVFSVIGFFIIGFIFSKYKTFRNFTFASFLVFALINAVDFIYSMPNESLGLPLMKSRPIATNQKNENVYYIIPDAMIGPEGYEKVFGKQLNIVSYLEKKGFTLNRPAFSNAPVTLLSVPHVLNMDYFLKTDQAISVPEIQHIGSIFKGKNRVFNSFHELGYTIRRVADGYVSYCTGYEDECIHHPALLMNQDITFLDRTQIVTVLNYLQSVFHWWPERQLKYPRAFEIDDIIAALQIKPKSSQFTFLHISLPHYPYRYQADCTRYQGDNYQNGSTKADAYHAQLLCAEKKYELLIDYIVEHDPDALILFQSDHGSILHDQGFKPLDKLTDDNLFENFSIISAYRLPQRCDIHQDIPISPVNSFRVIFGCLTEKTHQLLPSHSFLAYYLDWPVGGVPVKEVYPGNFLNKES